MRLAILLALVLIAAQAGAAAVVIPDSVDFYTDGQAQIGSHQITVHQEPTLNDYTSFFFDSEFDPLTSIPVLKNFNINVDEGSDWYLVREGDVFTPDAIANGDFVTIVEPGLAAVGSAVVDPTYWSNWPVPGVDPFPLQNWQTSFYLGFATSFGYDNFPERDIYGWVELQYYPYPFPSLPPNQLRLLGSATAFDSGGIVIGSLQAVPEPATFLLVAAGVLVGGIRRRG